MSPPCLLAGPQLMSAISFDISVMARWRTAESTEENVADWQIGFFNADNRSFLKVVLEAGN